MTTPPIGTMCTLPAEVLHGRIRELLDREPPVPFFDDALYDDRYESDDEAWAKMEVPPRISGLVKLLQGERAAPLMILEDGPGAFFGTGAALAMLGHRVTLVEDVATISLFLKTNISRWWPHEIAARVDVVYPDRLPNGIRIDMLVAVSPIPHHMDCIPWNTVVRGGYAVIQQDCNDAALCHGQLFGYPKWLPIFSAPLDAPVFNSAHLLNTHLHVFRRL